jgi:hypothetical protein
MSNFWQKIFRFNGKVHTEGDIMQADKEVIMAKLRNLRQPTCVTRMTEESEKLTEAATNLRMTLVRLQEVVLSAEESGRLKKLLKKEKET